MDLLLAEELLLLAYRPKGSALINLEMLDYTISAAVLAELILRERLEFTGGRFGVTDPAPVGDPELDKILGRLALREDPAEFEDCWTAMYTPARRERLLERLAVRGAITIQRRTYLKVFKEELFPEADPAFRESVRERVLAALAAEAEPDRRTLALVSLAHAAGLIAKALPKADRKRTAELAGQDALGSMVAKAFKQAAAGSVAKVAMKGGSAE
ncbi:GPP34 family phosphoprotein [Nonomuraea sp. NPDC050404]|uniref:GOLPH3/VPS74 family protein n=1 Tax=Nonomuraea sp. NPDC050404 TaxID=3155783 RepID=UPI0033CB005B